MGEGIISRRGGEQEVQLDFVNYYGGKEPSATIAEIPLTELPMDLPQPAAAAVRGKVIVYGGYRDSGSSWIGEPTMTAFEAITGIQTRLPNGPYGRYGSKAVAWGDYVYYLGGSESSRAERPDSGFKVSGLTGAATMLPTLTSAYGATMDAASASAKIIFSIQTAVWTMDTVTELKSSTASRSDWAVQDGAVTAENGIIFAAGGIYYGDEDNTQISTVDRYELLTLKRLEPTRLSFGGIRIAGAAVGGKVVFIGGAADMFDAQTAVKTVLPKVPYNQAVLTACNGKIVGLCGNNIIVIDVEKATVNTVASFSGWGFPSSTAGAIDGVIICAGPKKVSKYILAQNIKLPITAGSKYKFDGTERTATASMIEVSVPANGYIKMKKGSVSG